jgi:hypothetical protein
VDIRTDTAPSLSKLAGSGHTLPVFFMKPVSVATLSIVTLLGVGSACLLNAREARLPRWPKPTPPPPPSSIYTASAERVATEAEIASMAETHNQRIALEIEQALISGDAQRREAAFTFLLPELIQVEPGRVVEMFARQPSGKARDLLRDEIARQWVARDVAAATSWMKSLDEGERRASAAAAVASIAFHDPDAAGAVADELAADERTALKLRSSVPR